MGQRNKASFNSMRILIVTTPQYIAFHGQAIFTINLAEGLAKKGHTVTVLAGSDRGGAYRSERNGVQIEAVNSLDLTAFHPDSNLPLFSSRAVRRAFEAVQPDIVHIQDHYFLCRNAAIRAQKQGIKCIGTNHFMPENLAPYVPLISRVKPVFNWVLWRWMRDTYDRLKVIACPSTHSRQYRACRWAPSPCHAHLLRRRYPPVFHRSIRRPPRLAETLWNRSPKDHLLFRWQGGP